MGDRYSVVVCVSYARSMMMCLRRWSFPLAFRGAPGVPISGWPRNRWLIEVGRRGTEYCQTTPELLVPISFKLLPAISGPLSRLFSLGKITRSLIFFCQSKPTIENAATKGRKSARGLSQVWKTCSRTETLNMANSY